MHDQPSQSLVLTYLYHCLQRRDRFQNPCSSGGESFTVQIQGVAKDSIHVTDRNDGTYAVEYCVPAEGSYKGSITLEGTHVVGSPINITAFRSVLLSCCCLAE